MTDTENTPNVEPAATPADRLCIHPNSPFHNAEQLARGIGVRFRGRERTDVEEYSISEGWVRVALGRKMDRHGRPLTMKLTGPVEVWFQDTATKPEPVADEG